MRHELNTTIMVPKDLEDQTKAEYLVRFIYPGSSSPLSLYADEIRVADGKIQAFVLGEPSPRAEFSHEFAWYTMRADLLEKTTVGELNERERVNIVEREAVRKELQRVYDRATGKEDADPIRPIPQSPDAFSDFLNRSLGNEPGGETQPPPPPKEAWEDPEGSEGPW